MYLSFSCFSRWFSAVGCLEILFWVAENSWLIKCSTTELCMSLSRIGCMLCFIVCLFDISLSVYFRPDFLTHTLPFLPTLSYIRSLFSFYFLQHIYSVVLCCVSEDRAGVLLYNEFCAHVNRMMKSAKGSMFMAVFINIRSYVPGKKGGKWLLLLWMDNII